MWVNPTKLSERVKFYNPEEQIAYTGCIHKIKRVLEGERIPFEVCLPPESTHSQWSYDTDYRALQEAAVNTAYEQRYGVIEAPPGTGKTHMAAALIAKIGKPGILLVQQGEPFENAIKTLREFTNVPVAAIRGAGSRPVEDGINVIMIQSWGAAKRSGNKKILEMVSKAEVVIIDEMHNSGANTYLELFSTVARAKYIIGFSATPFRNDEREDIMKAFTGEVIYRITYSQAIDNNLLVPLTVICQDIPFVDYKVPSGYDTPQYQRNKSYAKVRKSYIIDNPVRNQIIADFVNLCVAQNKTVAIVVDNYDHGANLEKLIPGAVSVFGPSKERKKVWDSLFHREIKVVISTLLNEATDIASLDVSVLASGGKSEVRLIQRVRSVRIFDGYLRTGYYKKERGFVYLPMDNCVFLKKHSERNRVNINKLVKQHKLNEMVRVV